MKSFMKWAAVVLAPVLALFVLGAPAHAAVALHAHALSGLGGLALVGATNTLGNYNETFFAQEALIQLEKALGMAGRVYRGHEVNPQAKGSTIQVRRPSTFTAQAAPSTDQNITTDSVAITLDQWDEVKFSLTDKDLALTSDKIISDHIRPAAVALADKVDLVLNTLVNKVPWYTVMSATPALADITKLKKVMFDNKVPMKDESKLHFQIGSSEQMAFQNAMTVLQNPQASSLRDGSLGTLYGFDTFANQNAPAHTSGTAADNVGALTADTAVGDVTIAIGSFEAAGTVKVGDIVVIAGDPQQYTVLTNAAASGGAIAALAIYPAIKNISLSTAVVTVFLGGAAKTQNVAFHENAFCLATAPLSTLGNELGARIATVTDPITGLSLRSRLFYVGDSSVVKVALDVLFGVQVLDPNLAVRGYQY
jgi:hypothetical protein